MEKKAACVGTTPIQLTGSSTVQISSDNGDEKLGAAVVEKNMLDIFSDIGLRKESKEWHRRSKMFSRISKPKTNKNVEK